MKIYIPYCPVCNRENRTAGFQEISSGQTATVQDDNLYIIRCNKGHEFSVHDQVLKFALLFEIGENAILDGYNREAVTSFASSLERFYEFYVKAISFKRNINESEMLATWSRITNQSERQLGAFLWAYLLENGKNPPALENQRRGKETFAEFRNAVVHKGRIPTLDEAKWVGDAILSFMYEIAFPMTRKEQSETNLSLFDKARHYEIHQQQKEKQKENKIKGAVVPPSNQVAMGRASLVLQVIYDNRPPKSLNDLLQIRQGWRDAKQMNSQGGKA